MDSNQNILSHFRLWKETRQKEKAEALQQQSSTDDGNILSQEKWKNTKSNDHKFFLPFQNSSGNVKVFDNGDIQAYVRKSIHKRLRKFALQDSLFHVQIKPTNEAKKPVLLSILNVLQNIFFFVLNNIKTFFDQSHRNLVYLTIHQYPMTNGLNTESFELQNRNDLEKSVQRALDMLYRFLISDSRINLELNDTFKIYVHVLSIEHSTYNLRKNKKPQTNYRKKYGGRKKTIGNSNWSFELPLNTYNFQSIFENNCLLIAVVIGVLQNKFYESNKKDKRFVYIQRINGTDIAKKKLV